jgi:hypothetical protein
MTSPGHQRGQVWTVCPRHRGKLQTQPTRRFCVPHNSLGPDLPILNKKVNLDSEAKWPWVLCFKEQASQAQVPNSRNIRTPIAPPIDPYAVGSLDARSHPSRIDRSLFKNRHSQQGLSREDAGPLTPAQTAHNPCKSPKYAITIADYAARLSKSEG